MEMKRECEVPRVRVTYIKFIWKKLHFPIFLETLIFCSPVSEPHSDGNGGFAGDQLALKMLEVLLQYSSRSGDGHQTPVNGHLALIRDFNGITNLNLLHDAALGEMESFMKEQGK